MREHIKEVILSMILIAMIVTGYIWIDNLPTVQRVQRQEVVYKQSYSAEEWQQVESWKQIYIEEELTVQQETQPVKEDCYIESIPLTQELQNWIFEYCQTKNISPYLVLSIIEQESDYRAELLGDNGAAIGLMQIHQRWHQERMDRLGVQDLSVPEDNIKVGVDYLVELFDAGKEVDWVLMAYNGGRAYANRHYNAGKVSDYAKEVIARAAELQKEADDT